MNFIKHLMTFIELSRSDKRLTPYHISLYQALFWRWNLNFFENPISIARHEMMSVSKIGSLNTYIRTLKELSEWNYVRYMPSHSKHKGSQVYMYTFDTTCDNTSVQDVSPFTNYINNKNYENILGQSQNLKKMEVIMKKNISEDKEKSCAKKERSIPVAENENTPSNLPKNENRPGENRPPLEHVIIYFAEKGIETIEAEKFFNHFESNGWLVGGRSKMRDWKAAARNWILNIPKFEPRLQPNKNRATKLITSKNYNEPL